MKTEFEGYFSGDMECFCFDVDLETFKKYVTHAEIDMETKKEFNIEIGEDPEQNFFGDRDWQVHPNHIIMHILKQMGKDPLDYQNKKYKITIGVEEL
jgi:hypothetical protein